MTTDTTPEAVERHLDEQYDTQMEVERDPCGAWQAIETLAAERDALRDRLALYEGSAGPVSVSGIVQDMEGTIAALRAEVDRLRDALGNLIRAIDSEKDDGKPIRRSVYLNLRSAQARAALDASQ